jgi:hypothetical protein
MDGTWIIHNFTDDVSTAEVIRCQKYEIQLIIVIIANILI